MAEIEKTALFNAKIAVTNTSQHYGVDIPTQTYGFTFSMDWLDIAV